MSEYFPKPKSLGAKVKVELHNQTNLIQLDLSNYTTKPDFKNAAGVVTSVLLQKSD